MFCLIDYKLFVQRWNLNQAVLTPVKKTSNSDIKKFLIFSSVKK